MIIVMVTKKKKGNNFHLSYLDQKIEREKKHHHRKRKKKKLIQSLRIQRTLGGNEKVEGYLID